MYTTPVGWDRALFKWINGWSSAWEPAMRFFSTGLESKFMLGVLVVLLGTMIAVGKETRKAALCALIAFPLADGLTHLLKTIAPMPRPYDDPNILGMVSRLGESHSAGTASAHAANMMAVAICMTVGLKWYGVPWLALALLVGISRIYNGAHFPYQVILGWIAGAFCAVLVCVVWQLIANKRGQGKSENDAKPEPSH
jgi:undecaprenyl-diphosphatase